MLPMMELTMFALGILLIDLLLPEGWKRLNAVGRFSGVVFSAACVWRIQNCVATTGPLVRLPRRVMVDHFALYFWYCSWLDGHLDPHVDALSRS